MNYEDSAEKYVQMYHSFSERCKGDSASTLFQLALPTLHVTRQEGINDVFNFIMDHSSINCSCFYRAGLTGVSEAFSTYLSNLDAEKLGNLKKNYEIACEAYNKLETNEIDVKLDKNPWEDIEESEKALTTEYSYEGL